MVITFEAEWFFKFCKKYIKTGLLFTELKKNHSASKVMTIWILPNKNIKICSFYKGNGVAILNSKDYYSKIDTIFLDKSKFEKFK